MPVLLPCKLLPCLPFVCRACPLRCTHEPSRSPAILQYNFEEGAWDEVFPSAQSGHVLAWALNLSHLALGALPKLGPSQRQPWSWWGAGAAGLVMAWHGSLGRSFSSLRRCGLNPHAYVAWPTPCHGSPTLHTAGTGIFMLVLTALGWRLPMRAHLGLQTFLVALWMHLGVGPHSRSKVSGAVGRNPGPCTCMLHVTPCQICYM